MNTANHLIRSGLAYRDRPAVALGSTVLWNYGELANRSARIAGALLGRFRLSPGDRVGLLLHNCPEYVELLYAAWHAGLVAVPINAKLHPSEVTFILEDSGASLCFASPDLAKDFAANEEGALIAVIEVGGKDYAKLLDAEPLPLIPRRADDSAWLFYTSGTTGQPKGANLSHRNLQTMCHCYFADVDPVAPWSAILHAAPMSHGSGLYGLAYVMQAGCHVIPDPPGFDPERIYNLVERWPGVAFFAAPTMIKRLLDCKADTDTRNLKAIIYGGGPMYVEDTLAALERFGPRLTQLYGQGESPMTITALNAAMHAQRGHPRWLERLASVGIPQSAVEVRVAAGNAADNAADNSANNDEPAACGEVGEILVRGDSVMLGYWNNPGATAETLRGGWLNTGDCGSLDEEGFLTLKDRVKDLIISGGSNIYPREVEEVLMRHPGVFEVAVVGQKDREWGEIVVAYVVPIAGASIEAATLDEFCRSNMTGYKRPKHYHFLESLPKNNTGKVLKRALRESNSPGEMQWN